MSLIKQIEIILYAEDDDNDAFLLNRAFKQTEIPNLLVVVPDGNAAIQYLSGQEKYANREEYPLPRLILLDLKMPGKSGLEVLQWIRSQPRLAIIPVLLLTSSNQNSDIHRAYAWGANGYLMKPNKPEERLVMARSIKDYWLMQNRSPAKEEFFQENWVEA